MNITSLRRRRGWNQIDLAEQTKLSQPTVSRAENCDDSTTLGTLKEIAAALDVTLAELFADDRASQEAELLRIFRALPPDRQAGWLDMARLALQDRPRS